MATGLPVVPIVIRNSDSVAGRNATTLNPGTVDVTVLPPDQTSPTGPWRPAGADRADPQAYLRLLADWPATADGAVAYGPGRLMSGAGLAEAAGPARIRCCSPRPRLRQKRG